MLRRIFFLLNSSLLAMCFVTLQTSISNLLWLSSVDMPVTIQLIISMILQDFIGMSILGAFPIIVVVLVGLSIAFLVAFLLSKVVQANSTLLYTLSGGAALFAIVVLMPLAFYDMDLIAGARSLVGKGVLIFGGLVAGYYFGSKLKQVNGNEMS
jgi:hypothetical protein